MPSKKGRRYVSSAMREMLDILSLTGTLEVPHGWRAMRTLNALERQGFVKLIRSQFGQVTEVVIDITAPKPGPTRYTAPSNPEEIKSAASVGISVAQLRHSRRVYSKKVS